MSCDTGGWINEEKGSCANEGRMVNACKVLRGFIRKGARRCVDYIRSWLSS